MADDKQSRRGRRPRSCPDRVRALVVGGGGREHALAWKISQSPRLERLWVTHPENPALAELGEPCPESTDPKQLWRLNNWLDREKIDLVVVGPEAPLAEGFADAVATDHRLVFGPTRDGARLESDKAWAKQLMRSASIPTAESRAFATYEQAEEFLRSREDEPPVIKAAGLAAGKGVIVPDSLDEALDAIDRIMRRKEFGAAGDRVVIEERLSGPEVSVLALVDGRNIYVLEPCQDHKRLLEGGEGPNTGGMGAYCPTPILSDDMLSEVEREILVPTVDALRREEIDYRGVLYAGLMLTPSGPKVLEFNCRFGDPECQPLMMRLQGDFLHTLWCTASGRLTEADLSWDPRHACCVVMASEGYPGPYAKGLEITGITDAEALGDLKVFHAGTKREDGRVVTSGGRVLGVTALGETLQAARDLAMRGCEQIKFKGAQYRSDIGAQALAIR
ncbi:MAG: phosphoribosylamine--glycine ligase [Phycisphaerales bacterium]